MILRGFVAASVTAVVLAGCSAFKDGSDTISSSAVAKASVATTEGSEPATSPRERESPAPITSPEAGIRTASSADRGEPPLPSDPPAPSHDPGAVDAVTRDKPESGASPAPRGEAQPVASPSALPVDSPSADPVPPSAAILPTDPCASESASSACAKPHSESATVRPPGVPLQVSLDKDQLLRGEAVTIRVMVVIPSAMHGDLSLRFAGRVNKQTVFDGFLLLVPPYAEAYEYRTKAFRIAAGQSPHVSVSVRLTESGGAVLAVATLEYEPAAATDSEEAEAKFLARAKAACDGPGVFDEYSRLYRANGARRYWEQMASLAAAFNAHLALGRKAASNRDTYEDYHSYARTHTNSPCAAKATHATTIAYWMAREPVSPHVIAQLERAMRASKSVKDLEAAEAYFARLAEQGNPSALLRAAIKLYRARKSAEAEQVLLGLERTSPSRDVYLYLGRINGSDCRRSTEYLTKAIERDSACAECFFHRAECLNALGRDREAREDFRKTLALTVGHSDRQSVVYHNRSRARLGLK